MSAKTTLGILAAVGALTAGLSVAVLIDDVDDPAAGAAAAAGVHDDPAELLRVGDFPVSAPTWLPAGFRLTRATLEPGDSADGACRTVALRWEGTRRKPAAEPSGADGDALPPELMLEQTPAGCGPEITRKGAAFSAGGHDGRIVRPGEDADEPYSALYLDLGATRATIVTDLAEEDLVRVVRHLAPLSLSRP